MRVRGSLGVLLLVGLIPVASTAEGQEGAGDGSASATTAHRHFDRPIDFWRKGLPIEKPKEGSSTALESGSGRVLVRENVWAQPIKTPDGNWVIYVPPAAVLDFMENPTAETAKAYLAWKAEQARKLQKALALIAELKGQQVQSSAPGSEQSAAKLPDTSGTPFAITYFHQKECRHCVDQNGVLSSWLARHPEAKMETIERGERPELWKTHQVRGTPTIVLGDRGQKETLMGLTSEQGLEEALHRLRARSTPIKPGTDSERKD